MPLGVKGYLSTHCAFGLCFPNDLGCQGFSMCITHLHVLFGGMTAQLHCLDLGFLSDIGFKKNYLNLFFIQYISPPSASPRCSPPPNPPNFMFCLSSLILVKMTLVKNITCSISPYSVECLFSFFLKNVFGCMKVFNFENIRLFLFCCTYVSIKLRTHCRIKCHKKLPYG